MITEASRRWAHLDFRDQDIASELYLDCGLAVRHIELLSGQPAQTVLRLLHRSGVPVRGAGGRSPFLRRWRGGP